MCCMTGRAVFSLTYKVLTMSQPIAIFITWSPFNPLATPIPHLLLPFSPHWKSQIAHLDIHHLVFWNQLPGSFRQLNKACLDSPPRSLVNPSLSLSPLSAITSFTLSLEAQNLPLQQILPTLTFLLYSLDCLRDNGTGPDLSCSPVYSYFFFLLDFCSFRVVH